VEVFDLIRDISDPEHPLSLEQLNIVQASARSAAFCRSSFVVTNVASFHCVVFAAQQNMGGRRQQQSGC
jgi:hypothetical protein